ALVDGADVHTTALPIIGPSNFASAHGGFLVNNGQEVVLLDRDGRSIAGPVALAGALVAPFENAWVSVSHEDFLVARGLDGHFAASSPPQGISDDRQA